MKLYSFFHIVSPLLRKENSKKKRKVYVNATFSLKDCCHGPGDEIDRDDFRIIEI